MSRHGGRFRVTPGLGQQGLLMVVPGIGHGMRGAPGRGSPPEKRTLSDENRLRLAAAGRRFKPRAQVEKGHADASAGSKRALARRCA